MGDRGASNSHAAPELFECVAFKSGAPRIWITLAPTLPSATLEHVYSFFLKSCVHVTFCVPNPAHFGHEGFLKTNLALQKPSKAPIVII